MIRDVARFWASRASYDAHEHRYGISHVNSVAESNTDIANDTFTNVAAARALTIATDAARLIGERPDPLWERIARLLYIPLAADGQHHLAFAPTVVSRGEDFGGGPLSLLFLPSLDLPGEIELATQRLRLRDPSQYRGAGRPGQHGNRAAYHCRGHHRQ